MMLILLMAHSFLVQGHAASIRAQSLPAVEAHAAGRSRAPPSPQDNDAVLPLLNVYRRLSQRLGSLTQRMNAAAGVLLGVLGQQHADSLTITSHRLRAESVSTPFPGWSRMVADCLRLDWFPGRHVAGCFSAVVM